MLVFFPTGCPLGSVFVPLQVTLPRFKYTGILCVWMVYSMPRHLHRWRHLGFNVTTVLCHEEQKMFGVFIFTPVFALPTIIVVTVFNVYHLYNQARHSINPGVSTAYNHHILAFHGPTYHRYHARKEICALYALLSALSLHCN